MLSKCWRDRFLLLLLVLMFIPAGAAFGQMEWPGEGEAAEGESEAETGGEEQAEPPQPRRVTIEPLVPEAEDAEETTPEMLYGTLILRSTAPGATQILDGFYIGEGDKRIRNLPAGRHTIMFSYAGKRLTGAYTVPGDGTLELKADFDEGRIVNITELKRRRAAARAAAEERRREKVKQLLAKATEDIAANRLTRPAGNNALERLRRVEELDPGNETARESILKIAELLAEQTREAIRYDKLDEAQRLIDAALGIDPEMRSVAAASEALKKAKAERKAEAEERRKKLALRYLVNGEKASTDVRRETKVTGQVTFVDFRRVVFDGTFLGNDLKEHHYRISVYPRRIRVREREDLPDVGFKASIVVDGMLTEARVQPQLDELVGVESASREVIVDTVEKDRLKVNILVEARPEDMAVHCIVERLDRKKNAS